MVTIMAIDEEMVSAPKALLHRVLVAASFNSLTVEGEFAYSPETRKEYEDQQSEIEALLQFAQLATPGD